jgi:hypothetical protein
MDAAALVTNSPISAAGSIARTTGRSAYDGGRSAASAARASRMPAAASQAIASMRRGAPPPAMRLTAVVVLNIAAAQARLVAAVSAAGLRSRRISARNRSGPGRSHQARGARWWPNSVTAASCRHSPVSSRASAAAMVTTSGSQPRAVQSSQPMARTPRPRFHFRKPSERRVRIPTQSTTLMSNALAASIADTVRRSSVMQPS